MDRTGADFEAAVSQMRERLAANAWPIQIPVGSEANFRRCGPRRDESDHLEWRGVGAHFDIVDIPAELLDKARQAHAKLVEAVAEKDEEVMHLYLEDHDVTCDQLRAGIRRLVLKNELVPVTCGAAFKNKACSRCSTPWWITCRPRWTWWTWWGSTRTARRARRAAPMTRPRFCALAFKIWSDPYAGKLIFFRVYSGRVSKGMSVYNPRNNKARAHRPAAGNARQPPQEVDAVYSGDIGALVGLKNITTGDTICDDNHPILLETITFPEPVISMAIEPNTKADRDKMSAAMQRLAEEDRHSASQPTRKPARPSFSGMGELHLDIIKDACSASSTSKPWPGGRRWPTARRLPGPPRAKGIHPPVRWPRPVRPCIIRIEPGEKGTGVVVESKVVGGNIPKEYIRPVEHGIIEAAQTGVLGVTDGRREGGDSRR